MAKPTPFAYSAGKLARFPLRPFDDGDSRRLSGGGDGVDYFTYQPPVNPLCITENRAAVGYFSRRRPVRSRDGNLDFRIQYHSQDEFTPICEDFNAMAYRLQQSVALSQKQAEDKEQAVGRHLP